MHRGIESSSNVSEDSGPFPVRRGGPIVGDRATVVAPRGTRFSIKRLEKYQFKDLDTGRCADLNSVNI